MSRSHPRRITVVVDRRPGSAPARRRRATAARTIPRRDPTELRDASVDAARGLNRAAGMLASSVFFDSAIEHYRGSFHNKAMFTPLITAMLSMIVSAHGNADTRRAAHRGRDVVYGVAAITGVIGTAFHIYNIGKKPGGFTLQNLFYSAPIGAPAAISLSGAFGFLSERLRDSARCGEPTLFGLPAGRLVAAATSVGLLGTVGEAGLLHYRGAYHDPFMFLPVSVPPVTAAVLAATAVNPSPTSRRSSSMWLRATALLGFVGAGFHAFGVARNMGGWRNWRQNLLSGPPIPAPPSFTGLALAGLAALRLMDRAHDG